MLINKFIHKRYLWLEGSCASSLLRLSLWTIVLQSQTQGRESSNTCTPGWSFLIWKVSFLIIFVSSGSDQEFSHNCMKHLKDASYVCLADIKKRIFYSQADQKGGGKKVKIARDKSARRTSSYAGSFLIQEGFGSWPFNVYWVIQSSLSLYPKLIDTKNTVLAKLTIVPKSARRTSSYADIVWFCVKLWVKWAQGLQLILFWWKHANFVSW